MTRIRIAGVLLLVAGALEAAPEKPLPKELPPYAPDKPIPVAQVARKTLPNGLQVWVITRAGFPKVDINLAVRGGTASDPAPRAWVSALLAEMLTEGTKTHGSRELAEALQEIGGSLEGGADPDGIHLYGDAFKSSTDRLLELAAECAFAPTFPAEEVELAKANTLQELEAQEAQPSFQADRAFQKAIYGAHPYRTTALTSAIVKSTTREELAKLHAQRFRPDRSLLVVGGDVDPEHVFAQAAKAFGAWQPPAGAAAADIVAAPSSASAQRVVVDRPGSVQSTLRIGRPALAATDPDAIPLIVASVALGGSSLSRINRNVREDKGYTYGAYTRAARLKAGGAVALRGDVRSEVTGAAINEALYEFNRLGTTDVGVDELAETKRYVVGSYLFENQQLGAVVNTLASNWVLGLPPEYLAQFVPKVNAISAEQVRAMARKYYAAKDQTIVVVGDKAKIAADLAQFGEFKAP